VPEAASGAGWTLSEARRRNERRQRNRAAQLVTESVAVLTDGS